MIDMNHKYQTRDGRAVRILAVDLKGQPYGVPVCAAITERNGKETLFLYDENGRYNINRERASDERELDSDLIPVPTKHEGWCVLYGGLPYIFDTKDDAEHQKRVECSRGTKIVAHVTWES